MSDNNSSEDPPEIVNPFLGQMARQANDDPPEIVNPFIGQKMARPVNDDPPEIVNPFISQKTVKPTNDDLAGIVPPMTQIPVTTTATATPPPRSSGIPDLNPLHSYPSLLSQIRQPSPSSDFIGDDGSINPRTILSSSMFLGHSDVRPPRNRKPNYSENEKQIFFALIRPHIELLDAKSQERSIMQQKLETWKYLTTKYNEIISTLSGNYVERDYEELRTFWKNVRRVTKKRWGPTIQGASTTAQAAGKFLIY